MLLPSNRTYRWCITCLLLLSTGVQAGTYTNHSVKVGAAKREYGFYRPAGMPIAKKAPAILAFHGYKSDPAGLRWISKQDKYADKYGYVVIYPKAVNGSFNAGKGAGSNGSSVNELAFASALLGTAINKHNLNSQRIYSIGFSNGAQMSALLLCKLSNQVAGVAMIAHSLNIDQCKPTRPVPVILIQGAKDPYVPFTGGGKYGLSSHKQSVAKLKKIGEIKLDAPGEVIVDKPTIRCRAYGKTVRSCVGFNDGHTWPGGVPFKPDQFGATNKEFIANDFIYSFFAKLMLAAAPTVTATTPKSNPRLQTKMPMKRQPPATKSKAKANNVPASHETDESHNIFRRYVYPDY